MIITAAFLRSQEEVLNTITITYLVITWVAVLLRGFVRTKLMKSFRWDDWTMMISQFCFTILCGFTFATVHLQQEYDARKSSVSLDKIQIMMKLNYAAYTMTMIFVKISIGIFFLYIFKTSRRRYIICPLMAFSTMCGIVYLFMVGFSCGVEAPESNYLTCPSRQAYWGIAIFWGICNVFADAIFAIFSIMALRSFPIQLKAKVLACAILLFGCGGGVASCLRVVQILRAKDLHVDVCDFQLIKWSNVESAVCISAGSLVTLRPLFRCLFDRAVATFGLSRSPESSELTQFGQRQARTLSTTDSSTTGGPVTSTVVCIRTEPKSAVTKSGHSA